MTSVEGAQGWSRLPQQVANAGFPPPTSQLRGAFEGAGI